MLFARFSTCRSKKCPFFPCQSGFIHAAGGGGDAVQMASPPLGAAQTVFAKKCAAGNRAIPSPSGRSQDPRLSRGLEQALEGHNTDNAPQGATNGSANCIADSWRPLKGLSYALIFLLPVNGSINSFRLIWSAIWSSSNCLLMYSCICLLFRPTVST